MVVKERKREEHPQSGVMAEAGAEAEEQMAFYLRRAFAANTQVAVLNDLRLPCGEGDAAQIDHVLVHPFGFVLVESKSVTGSVLINEHGEWCRLSGGRQSGMRSPVVQARMQATALRQLLNAASAGRGADAEAPAKAGLFDRVPFDLLVAISDKGVIERRSAAAEVFKADVVPARVLELISRRRADRGAKGPVLDEAAREKIAQFLVGRHTPLRPAPAKAGVPPSVPPASPKQATRVKPSPVPAKKPAGGESPVDGLSVRCRFCGSGALHAQHGKYGYYFRCIACTKNTPIDFTCPRCSAKVRVRKDGLNFYKECGACGTAALFYVNASLVDLEDVSGGR